MKKTYRSYAVPGALIQAALLLSACGEAHEDAVASENANAAQEARPVLAKAVPISGPKRMVLALGDSLYAGYGLQSGQSLPDALQTRLRGQGIDATFVNAGVSGDTTAAGLRRLVYTLDHLDRTPDLVLLGLGGNDVLRQVDPAETRANLNAMLKELQRRHIPVVLTGMMAPPNLGPDFGTRFNTIWPELARTYHAALYPFILDGVIGNRALMLPDGVHPNAQGVGRIADRLAPVVQDRLKDLPERRSTSL